jgi:hypothetical protein
MKIRIAVARDGERWAAAGAYYKNDRRRANDACNLLSYAAKEILWIEAELPEPEERVVEGKVVSE